MGEIISQLPSVKNEKVFDPVTHDDQLKKLYSLLPPGDSVQFKYGDGDTGDYYALNKNGIRFIDLNFDGKEDLLYSGQSGWNNLTDTKVYFNNNDQLKFHQKLSGDVIAIDQQKNALEVFTLWTPCCDSYTSRIEKYVFSTNDSGQFILSVSFVGKSKLKGLPEFDSKRAVIKDLKLYASKEDFRGTSPWLRGRNREARDSLQNGHAINLIKLRGDIPVNILDQKDNHGTIWYLVITNILSDVPKSLYEWSSGNGRRLVGWTNSIE
ncbi:MAG: hypothetical protein ABJH04_07195 [Cyclobacteriaceae bacterium]